MSGKTVWTAAPHPWKWRLIVGFLMFVLAFIGVGVTVIKQEKSWDYWRVLGCLFALLSLGLSSYLRHHKWTASLVTVWHEILHWIGLILSITLLSVTVKMGLLTPYAASLQALILLSLATFLAGVYIEKTFLFIGILLGIFALLLSFVSYYSYLLFIPLSVAFIVGFYWFIRKKSRQFEEEK